MPHEDFKSLLVISPLFCAAVTYADDESALNQAITTLNAKGRTGYGKLVILAATSLQTNVPIKTLQAPSALRLA